MPEKPERKTAANGPVGSSQDRLADDRIYPLTRWVAVLITPFLLGAWILLYFFPTRTAELFAWPISPPMNALFIGSGFGTGAYFFIRAYRSGRWHAAAAGFLPVAFFAAIMAITTVLHWERFTQGHPAFITWVAVYAITPVLVTVAWLHNRRADPHLPVEGEVMVPLFIRRGMGLFGVLIGLLGLYFFIFPQTLIESWPWALTPLTARAVLAFIMLSAASEIMLALDARWSAQRIVIGGQIVGLTLTVLAVLRAWGDFVPTATATWIFVFALGGLLVGNLIYYRLMQAMAR